MRTIKVQAALDILPLYVRANALIPTIEPPQFTPDAPFEEIAFDAYLLDRGTFELRDTDGTTRISATLTDRQLHIEVEGVKKSLALRLLPLTNKQIEAIYVNGREIAKKVFADNGSILVVWTS